MKNKILFSLIILFFIIIALLLLVNKTNNVQIIYNNQSFPASYPVSYVNIDPTKKIEKQPTPTRKPQPTIKPTLVPSPTAYPENDLDIPAPVHPERFALDI